ncbi:RecX family transcriptional regulator [uncultured Thermanaerothrix sp.]|uniref:regulatory protein RecX n=1 Tax=uncultured Thermanaerothrix sp. TaxID=1195149 RepID=UPI00260242C5|nr:RecX family transcriptional regulator [uncultured Thermanaerothrix sp.]
MEHKITALRVQKRNPNRVNVYLDGTFAFGLSRIVAAWLRVGQMLSDEKIAALQAEETREAAYQSALRFLSHRPRSEAELRSKLESKGFEPSAVEATLQRLIEEGWVRDDRFARAWVESRSASRPRSRRLITLELRRKGISEENIQQAVANLEDNELAYQAGLRYARRLEGLDYTTFYRRMVGFLQRRGFAYGTVVATVRRVWEEIQATRDTKME